MNRTKVSKESAEYVPKAKGAETCSGCAMFHPKDNRCDKVRGLIAPDGWCKHWVKKEGKES